MIATGHTTTDNPAAQPPRAAPGTDAEIDDAVHDFMARITGTREPAADVARRYEHALTSIIESVSEVLAALERQR